MRNRPRLSIENAQVDGELWRSPRPCASAMPPMPVPVFHGLLVCMRVLVLCGISSYNPRASLLLLVCHKAPDLSNLIVIYTCYIIHVKYVAIVFDSVFLYDDVMPKGTHYDPQSLEAYLSEVIEKRGMSMTGLARAAGLSKQSLHNYLNGSRPTLDSCRKLAFYLNDPWSKIIALAYKDVDEKRLQSLIEMYLLLTDSSRHTAEDILQVMAREDQRRREGRDD
jgi:transcriptional regulator with XRE-family HTH domain